MEVEKEELVTLPVTEQICKNCKYWLRRAKTDPLTGQESVIQNVGKCERIKFYDKEKLAISDIEKSGLLNMAFIYSDNGREPFSGLVTRENFGCKLFLPEGMLELFERFPVV